jgi:hypothetical protein
VGKTSLVAALAAHTGHQLVRINLSEQTDMMDLLGTDLPTADGGAGAFQWSDGAFLAAVKVRPLPPCYGATLHRRCDAMRCDTTGVHQYKGPPAHRGGGVCCLLREQCWEHH